MLRTLAEDPAQGRPIQDANIEAYMIAHLLELMRVNDAPPEQLERLGLED